jgi:SAM-dependent MidA family methyltransferase
MASEARDEYLKALYALSKSDPSAWATYVEAFKVFTAYELERMFTTPVGDALVAIGMGRRMKELRDDCIDIEKIMEKYRTLSERRL